MESKELKVMTETELKSMWNNFSEGYEAMIEQNTATAALSFLETLAEHRANSKLKNKELNYVEMACGSGIFALEVLRRKTLNLRKAVLIDLSETMVAKTQKKLLENAKDLSLNLESDLKYPENQIRVEVKLGNVEKIDYLPDSSQDVVVSNLVLHIVESPSRLLSQAHRVLKSGNVAFFSVLAEYEDSVLFNAVPRLLAKYGWTEGKTRSIFYLGTVETLESVIPSDKFEVLGTQLIPVKHKNDNNLIEFIFSLGMYSEFVESLEEKKKAQLKLDHQELLQKLRDGVIEIVYYIRAVFIKKK